MVQTSAVFSDYMVLQREKPIRVFGTANTPSVTVSFRDVTVTTPVEDGIWCATLPPQISGNEEEMLITDGTMTIHFRHIAVGEVWLAGGQSNMEWQIQQANDPQELLDEIISKQRIRYYQPPKDAVLQNVEQLEGESMWQLPTQENAIAWSAVASHFANMLSDELDLVVGILNCNWGGTSASAWVSTKALLENPALQSYLDDYTDATKGKTDAELIQAFDEYKEYEKRFNEQIAICYQNDPEMTWEKAISICGESRWPGPMGPTHHFRPGGLYTTMLSRLAPYTLRGFIYYQGESDDHKPHIYDQLLTTLIKTLRSDFCDDTLTFLIVMLPMFKYEADPDTKSWCYIREAQLKVSRTVPNTGIAVILELGEYNDIHPKDKKPVAKRLFLQALHHAYHKKVDAFAPILDAIIFDGNKAIVDFCYADGGLYSKTKEIHGFELAGIDHIFLPAKATIVGEQIFLQNEAIEHPLYARYDWTNYTIPSIFSKKTNFPLVPFRNDTD